jgi:hypothetical protein
MDYLTANITRMGCKAKDFFSSVLSSLQMYTYTAWSKASMPAVKLLEEIGFSR